MECEAKIIAETDTRKSPALMIGGKGNGQTSVVERSGAKIEQLLSEKQYLENRITETIQDILSELAGVEDPLLRLLVYWRAVKGMSWDEIASRTGKESGTVKVYYRRCLKKWQPEILQTTDFY